ncbi:response regulator transcription factor [Vallicoccus soli]|uniref:response regulator transcription factor n=1 Tax=Vallicoccus soli TaxID=2339232 RepID=UPI001C49A7E2|nr:response regulator transcription factor [Vallicoccus soli]
MPQPPLVLLVEDEPTLASAVAARLSAEGLAVRVVHDGPAALEAAAAAPPDLVVLDLMLPGLDGLEVCRRLQARRPVPVLMLTARGEEADRVIGLGVGADDYLTKPFGMRELVARVRALLRRVERARELASAGPADAAPEPLALGPLRVDRAARRVSLQGRDVHLTPTEFDLLVCLGERPGRVLTREHLLARVWDWPDASGTRAVDSHVKTLRRKLGAGVIRTVHGVGYALEVPGE